MTDSGWILTNEIRKWRARSWHAWRYQQKWVRREPICAADWNGQMEQWRDIPEAEGEG